MAGNVEDDELVKIRAGLHPLGQDGGKLRVGGIQQARIGGKLHGHVLPGLEEERHALGGGPGYAGETVAQHVAGGASSHHPVADQQGQQEQGDEGAGAEQETVFETSFGRGGLEWPRTSPRGREGDCQNLHDQTGEQDLPAKRERRHPGIAEGVIQADGRLAWHGQEGAKHIDENVQGDEQKRADQRLAEQAIGEGAETLAHIGREQRGKKRQVEDAEDGVRVPRAAQESRQPAQHGRAKRAQRPGRQHPRQGREDHHGRGKRFRRDARRG